MPRTTREHSEQTAATIRATALRLFAERGYADVGLELVAAEAGVTRGAVYHHYGSKEGLFRAAVADAHAVVAAAVAAAAPGVGWDALEEGSIAFMRAVIAPGVARVLLVDGPAVVGWKAWRALDAEHAGVLLHEVLAQLPGLAVEPAAAAALLNGAMNEAALWVADGGDPHAAESGLRRLIGGLREA